MTIAALLPTVLRAWWGFFLPGGTVATAQLFIDYQNLHFTAWECFTPYGTEVWQSLVHPGKFADQVREARLARHFPDVEITVIHVYRGLPSRRHEPTQHARVQRQASNWTRDRRVQMNLRPLRYPSDWPDSPAQEKGVDVQLAIEVVRATMNAESAAARAAELASGESDLASEGAAEPEILIVATRDTDIVPALEIARASSAVKLELATWKGQSELKLSSKVRSVSLDKPAYSKSRDMTNYA